MGKVKFRKKFCNSGTSTPDFGSNCNVMKKENHSKVPAWAVGLLLLLLAVVGFQSVWLYRISEHLKTAQPAITKINSSNHQKENTEVVDLNTTPLVPQTEPPEEWDPFREMQRMREEMDQIFGDALSHFGPDPALNQALGEELLLSPQVTVNETDEDYTVEVDVSAMENPDINTKLTGQTLTINASVDSEMDHNAKGSHAATKEHRVEHYSRSILFDEPVQTDGMTQEVEEGILRIHVPKVHA